MTTRVAKPEEYGDYAGQIANRTAIQPNGCWHFTGYITPSGYGQVGRNIGAHRIAWEVANGQPVPDGLVVDHQCHNLDPDCNDNRECLHRRCVNPAHLEAVPSGTNIMRGKGFAPENASKTHCANNHAFTPENTYYRPDRPGRICITCRDAVLARGRDKWRKRHVERQREYWREQHPEGYAIREWAAANGIETKRCGVVSRAVREAYEAALRAAVNEAAA